MQKKPAFDPFAHLSGQLNAINNAANGANSKVNPNTVTQLREMFTTGVVSGEQLQPPGRVKEGIHIIGTVTSAHHGEAKSNTERGWSILHIKPDDPEEKLARCVEITAPGDAEWLSNETKDTLLWTVWEKVSIVTAKKTGRIPQNKRYHANAKWEYFEDTSIPREQRPQTTHNDDIAVMVSCCVKSAKTRQPIAPGERVKVSRVRYIKEESEKTGELREGLQADEGRGLSGKTPGDQLYAGAKKTSIQTPWILPIYALPQTGQEIHGDEDATYVGGDTGDADHNNVTVERGAEHHEEAKAGDAQVQTQAPAAVTAAAAATGQPNATAAAQQLAPVFKTMMQAAANMPPIYSSNAAAGQAAGQGAGQAAAPEDEAKRKEERKQKIKAKIARILSILDDDTKAFANKASLWIPLKGTQIFDMGVSKEGVVSIYGQSRVDAELEDNWSYTVKMLPTDPDYEELKKPSVKISTLVRQNKLAPPHPAAMKQDCLLHLKFLPAAMNSFLFVNPDRQALFLRYLVYHAANDSDAMLNAFPDIAETYALGDPSSKPYVELKLNVQWAVVPEARLVLASCFQVSATYAQAVRDYAHQFTETMDRKKKKTKNEEEMVYDVTKITTEAASNPLNLSSNSDPPVVNYLESKFQPKDHAEKYLFFILPNMLKTKEHEEILASKTPQDAIKFIENVFDRVERHMAFPFPGTQLPTKVPFGIKKDVYAACEAAITKEKTATPTDEFIEWTTALMEGRAGASLPPPSRTKNAPGGVNSKAAGGEQKQGDKMIADKNGPAVGEKRPHEENASSGKPTDTQQQLKPPAQPPAAKQKPAPVTGSSLAGAAFGANAPGSAALPKNQNPVKPSAKPAGK